MMTFFFLSSVYKVRGEETPRPRGKQGRGDRGVHMGMPAAGFRGGQWRVDVGSPYKMITLINAVSHC